MSTIFETGGSKLLEKPGKGYFGTDVWPISASEKLMRMFGSKRRDSEPSTGIDRQNQRLRGEFRTECAR